MGSRRDAIQPVSFRNAKSLRGERAHFHEVATHLGKRAQADVRRGLELNELGVTAKLEQLAILRSSERNVPSLSRVPCAIGENVAGVSRLRRERLQRLENVL